METETVAVTITAHSSNAKFLAAIIHKQNHHTHIISHEGIVSHSM